MPLDPWSIVLALVLSVFGFLVFLLWNKKYELSMIEKKVAPAARESLDVLIKNFLSFGDIPTKSKLISIMTSVARKHQVQLLTHLPIQNIIDNLVYHVISNDLLDPYKKKEISDNLIKLKIEPIGSEDYIQMLADSEESSSWRQKLAYSQLTRVLILSSLIILVLGVFATQFKSSIGPQATYIVNWLLFATIGFSVLVAGYTLLTVFSHFSKANKNNGNSISGDNMSALAGADRKLSKATANNNGSVPRARGPALRQQTERMMSINDVKNLNTDKNKEGEYSEESENQASYETI